MLFILDGEAEFTVDGRTALIKGLAGAPSRMGHSHALYNPTDKPVEYLNINVGASKGHCDNFDLGDSRIGVPKGSDPGFHVSATRWLFARACSRPPRWEWNGEVS
jgi:uncharacterized cupin superfamily protein